MKLYIKFTLRGLPSFKQGWNIELHTTNIGFPKEMQQLINFFYKMTIIDIFVQIPQKYLKFRHLNMNAPVSYSVNYR